MKNGGRVHRGELNKQLERVNVISPSITRNMINRAMQLHWTSLMDEGECVVVSSEDNDANSDFSRDRGGCPVGTTIVYKHENELRRVKVHNNITMKYAVEKRSLPYGKRLPSARLNEVRKEFTSKYSLLGLGER